MAKKLAIGLLLVSLALLIIYGADVIAATSDSRGFLGLDESVRGGALGGGAVIMSIIAFVVGRKDRAPAISVLLFVNGGLIIAGMLALIAQGALASEDSSGALRTIGSTMAMGGILVGLGAWKAAIDRKTVSAAKEESPQK